MLGRLLRRGGLSRAQEALLAEHVACGDDYVGQLVRDVSRAEQARWNALATDDQRWTPAKKWQQRARALAASTRDADELLRTILTHALAAEDGTRRGWGGLMRQWLSDWRLPGRESTP